MVDDWLRICAWSSLLAERHDGQGLRGVWVGFNLIEGIITNTILGFPCYTYCTRYPKTLIAKVYVRPHVLVAGQSVVFTIFARRPPTNRRFPIGELNTRNSSENPKP